MTLAFVLLGVCSAAALLTGLMREYALRRGLVDHPGERSSHEIPRPRGGGAAIVVALTAGQVVAVALGQPPWWTWPVVAAAIGVAALGFVDDHRGVAASQRLAGHLVASVTVVVATGGVGEVEVAGVTVAPWLADTVAVVAVAWFINFTNFMDGIDGIASVHVLTTSAGIAGVLLISQSGDRVPPLVLGAAVTGFLLWNWPPARIFMGDVGSGYLGLMSGALVITTSRVVTDGLWAALLLHGAFAVDATVTLVRRALTGERLFEAHRSHAYQMLSRWWGHAPVTTLYGAINVLWLWPWAAAAGTGWVSGPVALVSAWTPLAAAAIWMQSRRYTFPQ